MPPLPTTGERATRSRQTAERRRSGEGATQLDETQVARLVSALEAACDGDFSVRLRATGTMAEVAAAFNALNERNQYFARELVRVSKVVGREGRIHERAGVAGTQGSWAEKVAAVNELIDNLARPTIEVARVIDAVADGDLTERIQLEIDGQPVRGEFRRIGTTVNGMVSQLSSFADEVTRVAREVGTDGTLGGQARVKGVSGTWKDLTDSVNGMASNLTGQVRNIAEVTTAVAGGDLSKKVTVDVKGEVLELKNTVNTMVDNLSTFADEVTRVAREVGSEGKLGGQAQVKGVSGVWKDLTENVNTLAGNLTSQVRNIAAVTTAVANGDLSKKITVDVRGELLELKETVNTMVDQLSTFAAEVTRVAKEVGTEGKLGGQAQVDGVSGTWKGLTDNVNQLAETLTTQLRAIADVSTAVTSGDLTRSITVEAAGEVAELKDNINQMIGNLRGTTEQNAQQDWLNSNLARFSGMLQGKRDQKTVARLLMSEVTPLVAALHGAFYVTENGFDEDSEAELQLVATYGYKERKSISNRFKFGESIVGQAALERKAIVIAEAPGDYIKITSGLGEATPASIIVIPILFEDSVLAVMELASFTPFTDVQLTFLDQLSESIGVVLNTILVNVRTEELLQQSQMLTQELQSQSEELQAQQEELKRSNTELEAQAATLRASEELLQTQQEELRGTNEELEERSQQLEEQNRRIEIKNTEIELARAALEEKAEQLTLSSRYKSEFLANMSHELRTPLNSLLILAKLLGDNPDGNLTDKQMEFARTIHTAGFELLGLINDILDLSKVEAGKMDVSVGEVEVAKELAALERAFSPLAAEKGLAFELANAEGSLPRIETDPQRLQQILKNLLSNAIKFTEQGSVTVRVDQAGREVRFAGETLSRAQRVIAFSVIDTGIGIAPDKLRLIFEAFQQADGTTSRRFGGTGLGLSISREIARLLGGEIHVESSPGNGSTFTLYLPDRFVAHVPAETGADILRELSGGISIPPGTSNGDEPHAAVQPVDPALLEPSHIDDDRDAIEAGDRVVLIVEDDAEFARTELAVARERGFKGLVALRGDSGLALAREFRPDAIVLNMNLPILDGWTVLARLKGHPSTRHIPVHIVSSADERQPALMAGAAAFLQKPVSLEALNEVFGGIETFIERELRRLLVVDDDEAQREAIVELIAGGGDRGVEVVAVGSSEEALAALEQSDGFDCMVLDLKLPKMTGFALLEKVKVDPRFTHVPVIVYTGKDLTRREETKLKRYAETIVVKDARSPERLLDETSLFLHRVEAELPHEKRRLLEQLHSSDGLFVGKKVLIVDDDVRNVFALTSALEAGGMEVIFAENGRDGIDCLRANPDVDLVLMDVMMPELDGYETTRVIRELPEFERLPIIALTAKAMKADRERSIAAGASDYITKPVDTDQLLSLMRVWLYQ